jgi:hypothetical protein
MKGYGMYAAGVMVALIVAGKIRRWTRFLKLTVVLLEPGALISICARTKRGALRCGNGGCHAFLLSADDPIWSDVRSECEQSRPAS